MVHYIKGSFQIMEFEYESLEEAIRAGHESKCYTFKVYDHEERLCHDSHGFHDVDSYA